MSLFAKFRSWRAPRTPEISSHCHATLCEREPGHDGCHGRVSGFTITGDTVTGWSSKVWGNGDIWEANRALKGVAIQRGFPETAANTD